MSKSVAPVRRDAVQLGPTVVFRTQFNEAPYEDGEKNDLPSLTIPDQSLSVSQIMARYAQGLPLDGVKVPVYDGDDDVDLPDPRRLDLAERQELAENVSRELSDLVDKRKRKQAKANQYPLPSSSDAVDGGPGPGKGPDEESKP